MCVQRLVFVNLVTFILFEQSSALCDTATTAQVQEGILGQTPDFNWLGVLRVHIHDSGNPPQIAVTGIVLIKPKYALANADDIARIPEHIFKSDSRAMFIPADDTPWYTEPTSYVTHPEYQYATSNTIAIVELNTDDVEEFPLMPICLPRVSYNTSGHLYLIGYTDEYGLLEKVFYKIQYLEQYFCKEFYNRAGLTAKDHDPLSYVCGYAPYNKTQCVWDNGMVLVSNVSGWFELIGFGVRGPGCAAPARFIDLFTYFSWIHSTTSATGELYDSPDYRRQEDEDDVIPVHALFTANETRSQSLLASLDRDFIPYPFDVTKPKHYSIEPDDEDTLLITPFKTQFELMPNACISYKLLMYQEFFELRAKEGVRGTTTFKLTMFDLKNRVCVCVKLRIKCEKRSEAQLSFKERLEFDEGVQLTESGETPEELFRYYPVPKRTVPPTGNNTAWKPHEGLIPKMLEDNDYLKRGTVLNYDLYIKFEFSKSAVLQFGMYSSVYSTAAPRRRAPTVSHSRTVPSKRKRPLYWGMTEPSRRVKEPAVTLVADHAVVEETVSARGRATPAPLLIVFECLLSRFCSRRTF